MAVIAVGSGSSIADALAQPVDGAPVSLEVSGSQSLTLVLGPNLTSSEVWISAQSGAKLSADLTIMDGAPPVHLSGFEVTGRISVEGGGLDISGCSFRAASSRRKLQAASSESVLTVSGGQVTAHGVAFEDLADAIKVTGGELHLDDC